MNIGANVFAKEKMRMTSMLVDLCRSPESETVTINSNWSLSGLAAIVLGICRSPLLATAKKFISLPLSNVYTITPSGPSSRSMQSKFNMVPWVVSLIIVT